MITRKVDEPDGIIIVQSLGSADMEDLDNHYASLRALIAEMREAKRPIRVLSDQRQATRLGHELNLHIKAQIERTYKPGDRVALLMKTEEDQRYAREILGVVDWAVFNSRHAAEIWLVQIDQKPPAG